MAFFNNVVMSMFVAFLLMPASAFGAVITYDLNGGQLPNGDTVYQTDSSNSGAVLDNPTKTVDGTNYIFTGWCAQSDYNSTTNTCSNRVGLDENNVVRWTIPSDLATDTTYIALWEEDKFQITTTKINISTGDYFAFKITAAGEFYVDWGDGNIEYFDRTGNTTSQIYAHKYSDTDRSYTIHFGGTATAYSSTVIYFGSTWSGTPVNTAAQDISTVNATEVRTKIASVTGSLGKIFSGSVSNMFASTFNGCTGLTSISEDLFSGVSVAEGYMFSSTFSGCTSLTSIPEDLFSGISGSASGMFYSTFYGCTSLTSIPKDLFSKVSGANMHMFASTFNGCTGLTSIPEDLFSKVSGFANSLFYQTFYGCTSLTSIPENLFKGISDSADSMFLETFRGCTSLTALPNSLFPNITSAPLSYMFAGMFSGCTSLSGYVPPTLFGGMDSSGYQTGPIGSAFANTNLDTSCPNGMRQYITGFEDDWYLSNGCKDPNDTNCAFAVSCIADNGVLCQAGEYRNENGVCELCPIGSYCASVPTVYTTNDTGATQCGENATTPALGATECKCNYSMVWNAENNKCNCPQSRKTWTDIEVTDGYLHDFGNGEKACVLETTIANDVSAAQACIAGNDNCDWITAGLAVNACKYNAVTGDYDDCSRVISVCKSEDLAPFFTEELPINQMMTVMGLSSDTPGWDWDNDFFVNDVSSYNEITNTVLSANSYNMCCTAGEYMLSENGAGTCTACESGYYCPGGGFTTNETAGLENCPDEHSHPNADGSACECDTNYAMDENTGVCTVVCPATGHHYTQYNQDGSGIMEYPSGNSYDNTVANCVTMRMYVNDNSYIQGENPTAADYVAAGGRVAFCKYNTATGYYDGACTKAYTMCEDDDIATMMGSLATGGIIPLIDNLAGLTGNIDYNLLFTQPSNDVQTVDRCVAITCLAGTYLDTSGAEYTCSPCPAGFWCPGGAWVSGLTTDQGKNQCPTASTSWDGLAYTSAAESDEITDCYANCPSTPTCVANVANTSGNCSYVDDIATVSDTPVKYYGGTCATKFTNCNAGYSNPPTDITSWIAQNLESLNYIRMCTLDRNICNNFNCQGQDWCPTLHGGEFFGHIENGPITNVYGIASCNAFDSSTPVADRNFAPTATGVHCWVKLTKIDDMEIGTSGWIHRADYNSVNECSSECFDDLSLSDANDLPFLNALIASAYGTKVCTPNDITITWDGVENAGNAGMCTYGGNLTTPTAGPTVLPDYCSVNGCTFLGWVVQTTSGTSGGS